MEDTTWFEEKSEDEKLSHLSQQMYSHEGSAKTDFKKLLSLVPVDLVNTGQNQAPQKRGKGSRNDGFSGDYEGCAWVRNSAARCCL